MYSIGQLSRMTQVKIPTIRYYEQVGLLCPHRRTEGRQRRYDEKGLETLSFIKHARELGFSVHAIAALIELQSNPDGPCKAAADIAQHQLLDTRAKIQRLQRLERELMRIADGCRGNERVEDCYVLAALSDHQLCEFHEH